MHFNLGTLVIQFSQKSFRKQRGKILKTLGSNFYWNFKEKYLSKSIKQYNISMYYNHQAINEK